MILSLAVGAIVLSTLILILLWAKDRFWTKDGQGREEGSGLRPGSAEEALRAGRHGEGAVRAGEAPASPRRGSCSLCGSPLAAGERMRSDVFPGKGDRIMRIFGCPHCLPPMEGKATRYCPVCGGELGIDDHAVARYFERPGRRHVHVLGCTRCREKHKETAIGR